LPMARTCKGTLFRVTEPTVTGMAAEGFGSTLGSGLQDKRRRRTPDRARESRKKKDKRREDINSAGGWLLKKFMLYS